MSEIMKLREVAAMLRLSDKTIRRWLKRGFGPPCRISPTGLYLFDADEVREWWQQLATPDRQTR